MSILLILAIVLLAEAILFVPAAYVWWRCRAKGRIDSKGFPKPNTEWTNVTTGKTFTASTPSTDLKGEPVNPVVRSGFISVVWPKKTFCKHFK